MFSGGESVDEYEEELYNDPNDSSVSEVNSELEFHLYSQVHYAMKLDEPAADVDPATDVKQALDLIQSDSSNEDGTVILISDSEPILISDSEYNETISDDSDTDSIYKTKWKKKFNSEKRYCKKHLCDEVPGRTLRLPSQENGQKKKRSEVSEKKSRQSLKRHFADSEESDVENWMILDGRMHAGDSSILINLVGNYEEAENDENEWTICMKDHEAEIENHRWRNSFNRYYTPDKKVVCQNCNKNGHLSKNCPSSKKSLACTFCADRSHLQRSCPNRYCTNCSMPGHTFQMCKERYFWNVKCHRCKMNGHIAEACPELWRQYHLTTKAGPPLRSEAAIQKKSRAYCYNCSKLGHYGHDCLQRKMFNYTSSPFINYYDTVKDIHRRKHQIQKRAQELQKSGMWYNGKPQKKKSHLENKTIHPPNKKRKMNKEKPSKFDFERLKNKKAKQCELRKKEETEDFPRGPKKPNCDASVHSKRSSRKAAKLLNKMRKLSEQSSNKREKNEKKEEKKKKHAAVDEDLFLIKQKIKKKKGSR
ncbi:zinc finger CCHC domain-containing protein 7 [Polypterus senegalus]|uniref:zinc finger CCHC domain-containing protein 7 n=1 Tax=Polypterus senegalus TaxID=55291 RepID=UPI0019625A51|nr:zinc finger CCHC domain-containing protein 7 [Polypterus senegalus]